MFCGEDEFCAKPAAAASNRKVNVRLRYVGLRNFMISPLRTFLRIFKFWRGGGAVSTLLPFTGGCVQSAYRRGGAADFYAMLMRHEWSLCLRAVYPGYCSFVYSALACFRMGMSVSA